MLTEENMDSYGKSPGPLAADTLNPVGIPLLSVKYNL